MSGKQKFKDTLFESIYTRELATLAFLIVADSERLFAELSIEDGEEILRADTQPFTHLYHILSNAAKIQELVSSTNQGNQKEKEFHKLRAQALRTLLGTVKLQEILQKKVRNTVEHFAEYLDEMSIIHSEQVTGSKYMAAFDFVVSSMTPKSSPELPFTVYEIPGLKALLYPVRVYVIRERKFYNMGWSICIGAVYEEAKRLLEYLGKPDDGFVKDPREVAMMVACVPGRSKS